MERTDVLSTGLLVKEKPEVIDNLNNGQGTFLYNHNIKQVNVVESKDGGITLADSEKMLQVKCGNMIVAVLNTPRLLIIFSVRCLLQNIRLRRKIS